LKTGTIPDPLAFPENVECYKGMRHVCKIKTRASEPGGLAVIVEVIEEPTSNPTSGARTGAINN